MIYVLVASILKKQIQIGQTTIPLGLIPLVVVCFAVVMGFNAIYLNQRNRIIRYLQRNHPHLYEQVRRKPDIGPFYSTGYNPSKPLIALAKQSQTLNDPKLEKMLFDFVKFDQKSNFFGSIAIVVMLISILIASLILMN